MTHPDYIYSKAHGFIIDEKPSPEAIYLEALRQVYTMLPVKGRKIVNAAIAKAEGKDNA